LKREKQKRWRWGGGKVLAGGGPVNWCRRTAVVRALLRHFLSKSGTQGVKCTRRNKETSDEEGVMQK